DKDRKGALDGRDQRTEPEPAIGRSALAPGAATSGDLGAAHPLDLRRHELRRRHGVDHRRQPAEHRGRGAGGDPRPAQGAPAQQGARLRDRRGLSRRVSKGDGFWSGFGNDLTTGQPKTLDRWLDELAPKALAVIACGTCATYGGIHAMAGNPTGAMGLADYLGWDFRSKAGLPIINVPGCPVQPDNFMETVLYLLYQAAGLAPLIPLDEQLRPTWLFGKTVHEGCDRAA